MILHNKHLHSIRKAGFLHATLFIICIIFLIIVGSYHIGKRIPTGTIDLTDPEARRYENAGIESQLNEQYDRSFDSYMVTDIEAESKARLQAERAAELARYRAISTQPRPQPVPVTQTELEVQDVPPTISDPQVSPINVSVPVESKGTFTSKINNRISFQYPSGMTVSERKVSSPAEGEMIIFTLRGSDDRIISMTHDKVQSGCFDPIRAFAINPESSIDYRIMSPTQPLLIEGKYRAQRTDEEIGSYVFAGSDPARPFIYASNVCIQTAVPTRLRLSSTHFKAGEQGDLSALYDGILANLSL